jgi:hypothetical protein
MKTHALLRLGTLLIATAGTALAGQVTYTVDTGFQPTDNQTEISFPQFDPLLGNLNSIGFSLQGFANVLFTITNTGATKNMQYALTASVSLSLEDPTCAPLCLNTQMLDGVTPSTFSPSAPNGTTGPQGTLGPGASTGLESLTISTLPADPGPLACGSYGALCAFVSGSGTVLDIIDMADLTTLTSGGSSKSYSESASGRALLTVTYQYDGTSSAGVVDPTPEPFSMALCGLGLVGLSLAARKRGGRR